MSNKKTHTGFTLVETLVAISLLTISIVAPMSLASQSLATAYYARDQVTAFYLAQEAIETVRAVRDSQILQIAQSQSGSTINLFGPIPLGNVPFTVDARQNDPARAITRCNGTCPPLQTDGTLYGYGSGWADTNFTRTVTAAYIAGGTDEVRVTVKVEWQTGAIQKRSFSISENVYRWVNDGSGT
jgi:prepilin-type N-terminal cleavage/methylation domain-containing protein